MRGLVFQEPFVVAFERLPDAVIEQPGDALVRVSRAALCGSDLHPYRGLEQGIEPGTVMGHELVGEVVEVGAEVRAYRVGDQVFSPFTTSCGSCEFCRQGLTCRCSSGQLFGWVEGGVGLHGAQAELVRVPLADTTLVALPDGISPELGLLLGDNLATGYYAALRSGVTPGCSFAVVGCGSVGLLALLCAAELGAESMLAVDPLPERRRLAEQLGALALSPEQVEGQRAECVVEAVGNLPAMQTAFALTRCGGTLASVGVHTGSAFAFTPVDLYDRNLTYRSGRCPARHLAEKVVPIARRHVEFLEGLFTHTFSLPEGPQAYQLFDRRDDGCLKVLFTV